VQGGATVTPNNPELRAQPDQMVRTGVSSVRQPDGHLFNG
jgi:vacuolar-type H+-ATPase subunit B/Vma2